MELIKAVELIKPAAASFPGKTTWTDLGCGTGLFTRALSGLLDEGSVVYAVDKDKKALDSLENLERIQLHKLVADFNTGSLPLSGLHGILMANSLHFVGDKLVFINKCREWLLENGCFLLIEYDTDTPNSWVPYPLSFLSATRLFSQAGYETINKLGHLPSLYNRAGIYAALVER